MDLSPVLTPLFIFFARIADVSLGTIRITMVSRGYKGPAAFLGFFEVLIWVIVVAQVLANLDNWINYVAYAGGFAAGNYIGLVMEGKMKVGIILVRIITLDKAEELLMALREAGLSSTSIDAKGHFNDVKIIFTVVKRKRWNKVISIINEVDPDAFYSSEEIKYASHHGDNKTPSSGSKQATDRLLRVRKGI